MSKNKLISMHIQNLGKFYKVVLKILSGNEMMTDGWNDGMIDNPNFNIAPLFLTSLFVTSPECVYVKSKSRESIARELP